MPYRSINDLPDAVTNVLPAHAQEIFISAFNSAYDNYEDPEERRGDETRDEVAFKVAWAAVKRRYEKGDDDKWREKES